MSDFSACSAAVALCGGRVSFGAFVFVGWRAGSAASFSRALALVRGVRLGCLWSAPGVVVLGLPGASVPWSLVPSLPVRLSGPCPW